MLWHDSTIMVSLTAVPQFAGPIPYPVLLYGFHFKATVSLVDTRILPCNRVTGVQADKHPFHGKIDIILRDRVALKAIAVVHKIKEEDNVLSVCLGIESTSFTTYCFI